MKYLKKSVKFAAGALLVLSSYTYAADNEAAAKAELLKKYCTPEEKAIAYAKLKSTEALEDLSGPIKLTLHYHKGEESLTGRSAMGSKLMLTPKKLEGVAGSYHLVAQFKKIVPEMQLAIAQSEGAIGYDLMYFDRNLDGEFSDETAVPLIVSDKRGKIWSSGKEKGLKYIHQSKDNKEIEGYVDLSLWLAVEKGTTPDVVRYNNSSSTTGKVNLGGVDYEIVIQDFSNNGLMNDLGSDYWTLRKAGARGTSAKLNRYIYGSGGRAWRVELTDSSGLNANIYEVKPHMTKRELNIVDRKLREFDPDTTAAVAKTPIVFETDLAKALAKARELNTSCFLKFETTWCGPCQTLNQVVFNKQETADAAQSVVCVKIDGDKHRDLVKKYGVVAYPTMMMINADGELINKFKGSRNIKNIAAFLKSGKN